MKMPTLTATARSLETAAKIIRKESAVPCILYGNDVKNTTLTCNYSDLYRVYAKAGESMLVELDANGAKVPVLFHAIDFDPVTDRITHVDFYAVDMKKEIEAQIPVHFEGEAPAVKESGGVLVTSIDHLTVKCLPSNLPSFLSVDISLLITFQDSIIVESVTIPEGVVIQESVETVIATVQEPRKDDSAISGATEEGAEAAEGEGEKKEGEGGDAAAGEKAAEAKSE